MEYKGMCWSCRQENSFEYLQDEETEDLGWYSFDCCHCGEGSIVPEDNPDLIDTSLRNRYSELLFESESMESDLLWTGIYIENTLDSFRKAMHKL